MNLIAFKITELVVIILKEELPNQKKKVGPLDFKILSIYPEAATGGVL